MGAINGAQPVQLDAPLNFLTAGRKYLAHIYTDDSTVGTPTGVRVEVKEVDSNSHFTAHAESHGW